MKKRICSKRCSVLLSLLMIFALMIGMTGCAGSGDSGSQEQIVDNDLVVEVVAFEDITFKIGESWTSRDMGDVTVYSYPGTDTYYYVLEYGYFTEYAGEDNYFGYALEKLRNEDGANDVIVTKKMDPYVTADNRNAFISRIKFNGAAGTCHECDLLIFPEEKMYVYFDMMHKPEETVPLDIRELVDTATFNF